MTDTSSTAAVADTWSQLALRLWFPWAYSLAPQDLWQSINPGWSFGNFIVNQQNSAAPDTERAILSTDSYGRQLGKLLDAVYSLIPPESKGPNPKPNPEKAFEEIAALWNRVEVFKTEHAATRIQQLGRDLKSLKSADQERYQEAVRALRELVAELSAADATASR